MKTGGKWVFRVSRVLGAAPGSGRLYTCQAVVVAGLLAASAFLTMDRSHKTESALRQSLDRLQVGADAGGAVLALVLARTSSARLQAVLGELEAVDAAVGFRPWEARYLREVAVRLLATLAAACLSYFSALNDVSTRMGLAYTVHVFLSLAVAQLAACQHNTLLHTVQQRFQWLTGRLVELAGGRMDGQRELVSLVKHYNRLVDCCVAINEMYGKQILVFVGNIFLLTTKNAKYVIDSLIMLVLNTQEDDQGILLPLSSAYMAALRLAEVWSVVRACEQVKTQAKNFSSSMYQHMVEEMGEPYRNKKLRLHLTVQREPYFTAYGFFPLDFTLLHSILAAATTYLVILIQFSQSTMANSQRKPQKPTDH